MPAKPAKSHALPADAGLVRLVGCAHLQPRRAKVRVPPIRVAAMRLHPLRCLSLALLVAPATACTWVHMAPGASAVRVVEGPPAGCERRGDVEVSVKDNVAFYQRNDLRVREELETLARNEAPGLRADTVQPLEPPRDGSQRFAAWSCR